MNLFQQQASNRRRTWMVMAMVIGLAAFAGAGLDLFVIGDGRTYVPVGTVAALALSGGQSYWSLRRGDRAVLLSAGAVPVDVRLQSASDDDRLRYRQFTNIVEEMAIAAGVPPPAAYVIPDDDPNAFATGRDAAHASIAVTEGLLRALSREELQGVVAHEMAHIRNLDIRLMTVVAALVGMLVLVSDWGTRMMRFGGVRGGSSRRSKNGGGGLAAIVFVIWLLAVILAPFLGQLMAMAVSRSREYLADATGAELTRNPLGLARALETIDSAAAPTRSIKRGTAHLCISDPLGRRIDDREGRAADLFATHPPMRKRIDALKKMAYERA